MPLRLVEAASEAPVSLAAAKKYLRVDHNEDDAEIQDAINAATSALDGYGGVLGRCLVTQTWEMSRCAFGPRIRLPLTPVQSIASIEYVDAAGAAQTVDEEFFVLRSDAIGPYVCFVGSFSWPSFAVEEGLTVRFVAGYGAAAAVPADIRLAIKLAVELAYDRPEGDAFEALRQQHDEIVNRNRRMLL